ncbi:TolC family protein [Bradyrhizobium sp. HKCCYLS1011]|uniref:TolC family protein n=1 Tax=Bradyrhizobium sp. HKCCYLS1011 TaxID=3420733 RepID=UPI003EBDADE1
MSILRGAGPAVARFRWMLLAALVPPLAACAVGPDFFPPSAPLADKFLDTSNRSIKSGDQDYQGWWKAFHAPTLNELVLIGYNQNLTLLSAGTRVLQARAVLGIAIGSFYPQLQQGTGSLIYTQPSAATPAAPPNTTPSQFWADALAIQAAWELDFWGKFRRGVESADGAYLASIANYDDVLVTLLGDIAATYVGIRTTEQLIAIARSNISKQEESLKIAKANLLGAAAANVMCFKRPMSSNRREQRFRSSRFNCSK